MTKPDYLSIALAVADTSPKKWKAEYSQRPYDDMWNVWRPCIDVNIDTSITMYWEIVAVCYTEKEARRLTAKLKNDKFSRSMVLEKNHEKNNRFV